MTMNVQFSKAQRQAIRETLDLMNEAREIMHVQINDPDNMTAPNRFSFFREAPGADAYFWSPDGRQMARKDAAISESDLAVFFTEELVDEINRRDEGGWRAVRKIVEDSAREDVMGKAEWELALDRQAAENAAQVSAADEP